MSSWRYGVRLYFDVLSISGLMYRIRATQRWNNMPVATSESSLSLRPSPIECKEQEHRLLNSRKYINTFKSAPAQKTPWTALQTKRTRTESSNWRDSMLAWSLVSNSCPIAFFTWGLLRVNTATPVPIPILLISSSPAARIMFPWIQYYQQCPSPAQRGWQLASRTQASCQFRILKEMRFSMRFNPHSNAHSLHKWAS